MSTSRPKMHPPAIAGGIDFTFPVAPRSTTKYSAATAGGIKLPIPRRAQKHSKVPAAAVDKDLVPMMHSYLRVTLTLILTLLASLILLTPTRSFGATKIEQRKSRAAKRTVVRRLSRAEMKAAQQRLDEMGYGAGPGALIVFQKWEERKVTGRMSREDHDAIMNAEAPRPKDSGYRHVEVDLDRQVLLMIDDEGVIRKMIPVSTGSNKQYREKGGSGLAYTPRGRFRVINKIAGWRKSPLGLLYYPSYFSGGVAIHGNPSVPTTPQSHGCIRIPMSQAVGVFKQLPMGTIILIYDDRGYVSAKDWAAADREKEQAAKRVSSN